MKLEFYYHRYSDLVVTEEGFEATEVIPGNISPQDLTDREIKNIRDRVLTGGHVGSLVANDFSASLMRFSVSFGI